MVKMKKKNFFSEYSMTTQFEISIIFQLVWVYATHIVTFLDMY